MRRFICEKLSTVRMQCEDAKLDQAYGMQYDGNSQRDGE